MSQVKKKLKIKDRASSELRLLKAAEEVFSKRGFAGATTREIAKKANMNIALIARYFNGKYGLLLALLKKKIQEYRNTKLPDAKDTLTDECLSFASYRFNETVKDMKFIRIFMGQCLTDEKFSRQSREILNDIRLPEFEDRIQKFIDTKKASSKCKPIELFNTIECMTFSMVFFEVIMKNEPKEKIYGNLKKFVVQYASLYEL